MDAFNINPKEIRKTVWHIILGMGLLIVLWRLPEIILALKQGAA